MTRRFLSARQWRTVEAFADVFIEGRDEVLTPAEITENIDAQLAGMRTNRTQSLKPLLGFIEYGLPLLSFKWRFSRLSRRDRRRLIERHLAGPGATGPLRQLARIRSLFLTGYYGDLRVHPHLQFVPVQERARNRPPNRLAPLGLPPLAVRPPTPGEKEITCDVCVIGSGAGGAVVAARAAAEGHRVVVLEEGPYVRTPDIVHDEALMVRRYYKEGGLQTTVDLNLSILQGKCVGGTTVINNAISFRLQDPDLNPGTNAGLLADWQARFGVRFDPVELDRSYEAIEDRLDIRRISPDIAGINATLLFRGWEKLKAGGAVDAGLKTGLFRKNLNQCGACGYCNFGCPYERKLSMLETFLADAVRDGARVMPECHAVRIRRRKRRVEGVEVERPDGTRLFVRAGKVVVSCGAIGSSVLLMKSGFRKKVGEHFSFNVATPMLARFPEKIDAFDAVQMAAFLDGGDFILETLFNPPMSFSLTLPGWFETHFDRMRAYDHFTSAGVVVGTTGKARVKRWGLFRRLLGPVKHTLAEGDLRRLKRGMTLMAGIYFAAGAEAVYPATFLDCELRREAFVSGERVDLEGIARMLDRHIHGPGDLTLNSSHPQGGNALSDSPKRGVIDGRFRVHGTDNLFVVDASVFPTTIHVNPQLTIMAMADYAWRLGIR